MVNSMIKKLIACYLSAKDRLELFNLSECSEKYKFLKCIFTMLWIYHSKSRQLGRKLWMQI